MPKVIISDEAMQEFRVLDNSLKGIFAKHLIKLESIFPKKHLKNGLPYFIEKVGSGRIICRVEGEKIYIGHIFKNHKEYEK